MFDPVPSGMLVGAAPEQFTERDATAVDHSKESCLDAPTLTDQPTAYSDSSAGIAGSAHAGGADRRFQGE
ncbi:hypothetical protein GCM10023175_28300 [Pseudonocardia xishanensis]|uniref:ATP-grasp target RiPP n=1 Tax=Pseudonocardia xishanensis TaxID=630995 RepID=A0ABP8RRJ1_9PSEU